MSNRSSSPSIPSLSPALAQKFYELCNWAHTVWSMYRTFQEDPRTAAAGNAGHGYFLHNLALMSQEYTLLQMAKLHDPACQQRRINLTIEYVIEYGGWDITTKAELIALSTALADLYARIQLARHRTIAHNDLATLLTDDVLGSFPAGLDDSYFSKLEQFVAIVQQQVTGVAVGFDHFGRTDVEVLLKALLAGTAEG